MSPVNKKMIASMKKTYAAKRGKDVYYAMEMKAKNMGMGGMKKMMQRKHK